jgi:hypothetical protein
MNIPDHISEGLETIFWFKILKLLDADPGIFLTLDPGSGIEKIRIRDKHPRSATLLKSPTVEVFLCGLGELQLGLLE